MARPLRIEFSGAVYHVTSRGDRRESIFVDDEDRSTLLVIVGQAMSRFDAQILAYCLMGNHYHFVLHTRRPNLSAVLRHVNGVYTQWFNRRHDKVGHLFQGRFKAVLVDRDAYLLEVCRYVELNPVRAKLVRVPQIWQWSSCRAHLGMEAAPEWLDVKGLHGYLLGWEPKGTAEGRRAAARYAELLSAGADVRLWDTALKQQIYLGDEAFVARMQARIEPPRARTTEIPRTQRQRVQSLADWLQQGTSREEALHMAHTEGGISMTALAAEARLSVSRVSRLIARVEGAKGKT